MYILGGSSEAGLQWSYEWSYADMYALGRLALTSHAWSFADIHFLCGPTLVGLEGSYADMSQRTHPGGP